MEPSLSLLEELGVDDFCGLRLGDLRREPDSRLALARAFRWAPLVMIKLARERRRPLDKVHTLVVQRFCLAVPLNRLVVDLLCPVRQRPKVLKPPAYCRNAACICSRFLDGRRRADVLRSHHLGETVEYDRIDSTKIKDVFRSVALQLFMTYNQHTILNTPTDKFLSEPFKVKQ